MLSDFASALQQSGAIIFVLTGLDTLDKKIKRLTEDQGTHL